MNTKEADVEEFCAEKISAVNERIAELLESEKTGKLNEALRWAMLDGGKRLRPCLALIACEAVGGESERALPFAVGLELLHNFTLVHDDVMDDNPLRHGKPAVHVKFGPSTAIIAGDALFSLAIESITQLDVKPHLIKGIVGETTRMVFDLCTGQESDIGFDQTKERAEEEYLAMIEHKTAKLYEIAMRGGALIGDGKRIQINNLAEYGRLLGISFQIWDDCLDLTGDEKRIGKQVGTDIREGKQTLLIIDALRNANPKQKKVLDAALGNPKLTKKELDKVIATLDEIGSFDYAIGKALDYVQRAKSLLGVVPNAQSRKVLIEIAEYVIRRDR